MKQRKEEKEEDALLINAVVEVAQGLGEKMIEMKEAVETTDRVQDSKKEMIETKEAVETTDQVQDSKKEMIEMKEAVETTDQVQDSKKELDFQGEDKTLETSFH